MKKILPVFLMILTCGAAHALPVGNPAEASLFTTGILWGGSDCCDPCDPCFSWCDAWSLRMGFYGDYVFNRHLENKDNDATIRKTEIYTNAGYLALNFCDRVDIFTSLGASNLEISGDFITLFSPGGAAAGDLDRTEAFSFYTPTFSWSIGARGTLWECDCLSVGLEGQYFRFCPQLDAVRGDADVTPQSSSLARSKYSEWQVGLGAAYNIETQCPSFAAIPYIAVKWAGAKMKNKAPVVFGAFDPDDATEVGDYENSNTWGYAVGSSFTVCHTLGVTVEGRFGDEKAFYVNGQLRF